MPGGVGRDPTHPLQRLVLQDGVFAATVRGRPNGPERRPELRVPNGRHAQRKLHLRVSLSALLSASPPRASQ